MFTGEKSYQRLGSRREALPRESRLGDAGGMSQTPFASIEDAIEAIRCGRMLTRPSGARPVGGNAPAGHSVLPSLRQIPC
jgi:hypothetical protein